MARSLNDIVAHIRMVVANPAVSTTLIQTEDLEVLCAAAEAEESLGYATRLAQSLWEQHWKAAAPQWKPLPDLLGVLTQIDNMTAGLVRTDQ